MPKQTFKLSPSILWPLVALIVALSAFYFKPWQTKPQETINVTAEGKTQVAPNVAKVSAAITTQNQNLDTARSENEKKVQNLVNRLKELGVEEKNIKTQNISAGPDYSNDPQVQIFPAPPRPNTNQISTTLEVTITSLEMSDEILSAFTQNGATNIYSPALTVEDKALEEAKSKAREDAVANARQKAEELAKLSQRKLGKVVKITEQDFGYPVPMLAKSETDLMRQANQIQPGQNEVTINVSVDFALK